MLWSFIHNHNGQIILYPYNTQHKKEMCYYSYYGINESQKEYPKSAQEQNQKDSCFMTPFIRHFRKHQTMGTKTTSTFTRSQSSGYGGLFDYKWMIETLYILWDDRNSIYHSCGGGYRIM